MRRTAPDGMLYCAWGDATYGGTHTPSFYLDNPIACRALDCWARDIAEWEQRYPALTDAQRAWIVAQIVSCDRMDGDLK